MDAQTAVLSLVGEMIIMRKVISIPERNSRAKLRRPMIMSTIIEWDQRERLREIAFRNRVSMAELIRDALESYLRSHP